MSIRAPAASGGEDHHEAQGADILKVPPLKKYIVMEFVIYRFWTDVNTAPSRPEASRVG